MAKSEDELQKSIHKLERTATEYNMKMSAAKTKTMAFKGREPVRSKIIKTNKILEQVNTFRYLGVDIFHTPERLILEINCTNL